MRNLGVHVSEAIIGDDLGGLEILELGGIRAGLFGKADQELGPVQAAVMVGGDVCDEISGMFFSNQVIANLQFHIILHQNLN